MPKPSNLELKEARGLSIFNAESMDSIVDLFLQDRTRTSFIHKLNNDVIADLKALHPYMKDTFYGNLTFQQLVRKFESMTFPEGNVFFWQNQVIYTLHALNLKNYPGHPFERPKPPSKAELAHRATLRKYFTYPQQLRKHFHDIVLEYSTCPNTKIGCSDHFVIVEAWNEVTDLIKPDEFFEIQKNAAVRFGKVFGSMCNACQSVGKGKWTCSRCHKVFYCGKDCQKADWPQHKKECGKKEDTVGSFQ